MKSLMKTAWLLAVLGAGIVACADVPVAELSGEPVDLDPASAGDGKFEEWNAANNPAHVDSTFLYYVHQLPLSGGGRPPIPGDYWAISNDNLNYKWDGSTS